MSNKMNFWSILSLVISSQIGSGIFTLPAILANYGYFSILGWVISSIGASLLSLIFSTLYSWFPSSGGIYTYVGKAFGSSASFFVGWTYWVVSWVSTTAVVIASIGYLTPIIKSQNPFVYLLLEILLLLFIAIVNSKSIKTSGNIELFLTILKIIPLILIPILSLKYFDFQNLKISKEIQNLSMFKILGRVILLTLWGFVGLESAVTFSKSVDNSLKNIPKAIILGTIFVAFIYIINSTSIIAVIDSKKLSLSKAPYVDMIRVTLGEDWSILISIIASIVCIGTLNAWILASSQIASNLSDDGFIPKFLGVRNKNKSPVVATITSCVGIIPLLVLTLDQNISNQITKIIDFSIVSFLFIYFTCCLAHFKLSLRKSRVSVVQIILSIFSCIFCIISIYYTSVKTFVVASCFTLSGFPVYIFYFKSKNNL